MVNKKNSKFYIEKTNICNNSYDCKSDLSHYNCIPKTLFFIWINDEIPDYVNFSIDAFKKVNPEFDIQFYHYSISDIENPKAQILIDTEQCIFDTLHDRQNKYFDFISRYIREGRKFSQIVSNVLRFELLNQFGGIYLDCDTFPIRKFDDNLLQSISFCPQIKAYKNINKNNIEDRYAYDLDYKNNTSNYKIIYNRDIFFIGQCKDYNTIKFSYYPEIQNCCNTGTYIRNNENDQQFRLIREKFFNCQLKLSEHYYSRNDNFYIDHFCNRSWQKGDRGYVTTPSCKFDKHIVDRHSIHINGEYPGDAIFSKGQQFIYNPTIDDYLEIGYHKISNSQLALCNEMNNKIDNAIDQINNSIIPKIVYL